MRFFEDIEVGEVAVIGSYQFTPEAIAVFAAHFGSQPPPTADGGGRACGWHVACAWMRLLVDYRRGEDAALRARGEPTATLGPSPGFRDLEWPHPVHAGDTVTYRNAVIDKRPSVTRPRWGLLISRNSGANQHGDTVLTFVSTVFVERRPAAS